MIATYIVCGILTIMVVANFVMFFRAIPEHERITLSDEIITQMLIEGLQGMTAEEIIAKLKSEFGLGRPRLEIMAENLGADMTEVSLMTDDDLLQLLMVLIKTKRGQK